jgi:benzodiazapine receptor
LVGLLKKVVTILRDPRLLQAANVVGFSATLVVNILANALPINGRTTAELSDAYPNLFTPAGYVFSIWGIIYALLLVFTVYQALPSRRGEAFLQRIGLYFLLGSAANVAWIFLWHYEHVLVSVLAMFALLLSLILAYLRLGVGGGEASKGERIYVHLPFSVYLGWITVAPIANVAAALVSVGWGGLGIGEVAWTVLMIAVAVVVAGLMILRRGDTAYSLVIVWALGGIMSKQMGVQGIVLASGAGILAIVAMLVAKKVVLRSDGLLYMT